MTRLDLTPWSRYALAAAGVNQFALAGSVPPGWRLHGWASRAAGPFEFEMHHPDGRRHPATAHRVSDIAGALERLFVLVAEDSLEEQLAASLEAIR